ncbi:unnamed protein product, partial [marine sediment metagenome]
SGGKNITNMNRISIGDIVFANGWRLTEVLDGIALLDERGNIIRRWTNV